MTAVAQRLEKFLSQAKPESANEVARMVSEVLEWAEADATEDLGMNRQDFYFKKVKKNAGEKKDSGG